MLLFGLAFTLKWLTRWEVVAILFGLLICVAWLAPKTKLKHHFFRQHEVTLVHGATWYFLTLLVLTLIFPLPIVAASWGVLSFGDGMATLWGRQVTPRRPLPWNPKKTVAGSTAFVVFGALGCALLLRWMLPDFSWQLALGLGVRTAFVAGLSESLPWRIDDNITVATVAAMTLYFSIGLVG